jgi:hypothetical protein
MRNVVSVGAGITGTTCVAVTLASLADADPTLGHFVNVRMSSPPMRCEVGADDSDGAGPNVVCQASGFSQAPTDSAPPGWHRDPSVLHRDQAIITDSGQFIWRTANLGLSPPAQPDVTLADRQTYHFQGWTIVPTGDGITFTNEVTGHGMAIGRGYNVKPL